MWTKETTKNLDMCAGAPEIFVMFIAIGSSKLLVSLSTPKYWLIISVNMV